MSAALLPDGAERVGRLNAPNREAWLTALICALQPIISKIAEVPNIRIACGFPSKRALARKRVLGECWPSSRSGDGTVEIFISPLLDDPFEIAHTVLHEVLHAVVGHEHGHRGPFKRAARRVGLVGPPSATSPSDELASFIRGNLLPELGPYPHARVSPGERKVQTTRLIKARCESCGCTIRLPRKWIHDPGPPLCACNSDPMVVEWQR